MYGAPRRMKRMLGRNVAYVVTAARLEGPVWEVFVAPL